MIDKISQLFLAGLCVINTNPAFVHKFFLAHAVHARGSDGHQNVFWLVNYSEVVREQVKCKKPDVFRMPKQNDPEQHKHKPKTQQEGRHPVIYVKHYAFRKMKPSERSVPLHDDIAIPASKKMSQVSHTVGGLGSEGDKTVLLGHKNWNPISSSKCTVLARHG